MPKMYRNRTLVVAAEGTYGTIETMTNADAIRAIDPVMDPDMGVQERDKSDGTLGSDSSVPEDAKMTLKFKNKNHGDGSSGDPAWAAELFPCVGMPSNTSNSYQTSNVTSNWKGLSAALNRDGKRRSMRGAMGDLTMTWEAGKCEMLEWSFMGGYAAKPTATAQLSSITFEEAVPPKFSGSARFTVDGSTSVGTKISKATLKLNTRPFYRHDPNAVGGYIGGWLQDVRPTLEIDPEAEAVGTKDWQDIMDTMALMTIVFVVGTTSGNTITTTCTNCQVNKVPTDQERNGILVDALGFQINGTITKVYS